MATTNPSVDDKNCQEFKKVAFDLTISGKLILIRDIRNFYRYLKGEGVDLILYI